MGAVLLFVSYYCIALPIGVPLMFLTEMRSAGKTGSEEEQDEKNTDLFS